MAEVKKQKKMPRKKATKRQKMDWFAAYVFIAPVTIGLFAFYIWPFFQNLWFSFNDVNKFNVSHFVGLENYKNILTDMTIWRSFGNTLKYVVITVPVGLFFDERRHQRKISVPYPVFPALRYHVRSGCNGMEMGIQRTDGHLKQFHQKTWRNRA